MTKHEADVIGGLNMTDQISNEAYKQIMIAAQDENEPCEDCISRQAAIDACDQSINLFEAVDRIKELPPVNPQKPICPSAGIDCEDCPAYEDAISREAVIDGINEYFHDEYYQRTSIQDCRDCLIEDVIKNMPSVTSQPKSEWQQDHEILKAYSDGASAVLDKVRAEIDGLLNDEDNSMYAHGVMDCLEIIDKFMAEGSEE